jgi:hypothetical protein
MDISHQCLKSDSAGQFKFSGNNPPFPEYSQPMAERSFGVMGIGETGLFDFDGANECWWRTYDRAVRKTEIGVVV